MNPCLCGHADLSHPGGACIRPACGCQHYRPDPDKSAPREKAS
jgi:hypothetical protein